LNAKDNVEHFFDIDLDMTVNADTLASFPTHICPNPAIRQSDICGTRVALSRSYLKEQICIVCAALAGNENSVADEHCSGQSRVGGWYSARRAEQRELKHKVANQSYFSQDIESLRTHRPIKLRLIIRSNQIATILAE
jgi:hypothetical protein